MEYRYITFFSLHFCRAVLSALLSTRTRKSYSIAWDECGLQPLVLWAVEEDHTRTCSSFSPELLSLAQLFWSDFSSLSTLQWSSDWCQVHFHFCVQKLLCVHRGLSSGCCFYHLHFFAKKVTLTSFFFLMSRQVWSPSLDIYCPLYFRWKAPFGQQSWPEKAREDLALLDCLAQHAYVLK